MTAHVEELLLPLDRNELGPAERARVEAHLARCADCRAARAAFGRLVAALERTAPEPPPIHWGAYRAELRDRLERARTRRPAAGTWWRRPLPALAAAGLVAVLVWAGLQGPRQPGVRNGGDLAFDQVILASQLDMIGRLDVVQRLELLEDFDVIGGLDRLPAPREG